MDERGSEWSFPAPSIFKALNLGPINTSSGKTGEHVQVEVGHVNNGEGQQNDA